MKKAIPFIVAAGALYYYDQNVDPIISRNFHRSVPAKSASNPIEVFKKSEPEKATDSVKAATSQFSKDIESKYNQFESKTSELANRLSSTFVEKKDDVSRYVNEPKFTERPAGFFQSKVAAYLDAVNAAGDKLSGKSKSVEAKAQQQKASWFTFGSNQQEKLQQTYDVERARAAKQYELAKAKLDELKNSFDKQKSPDVARQLEAAQKDFNSSLNNLKAYGRDFIDQTNKDLESAKNSWWKWGQSKSDQLQKEYDSNKAAANSKYEAAKKRLDDLTRQVQSSNPFKTKQEELDHLQAAKDDLSSSYDNLKKFGSSLIDKVTK
ncbi:hypothetical protein PSN45_000372 [Yamadazyma tenuis]|uniref:37 kDa cell surface protein n=1 Tax=Candida tenuis (strain ATCC 10573 / BCRC 21748 / CBS 615 / JCM 9827 / NBRC 10315 / NRRL Y-1498 / VKM Y-70) TaxID=590646 RepID=G3B7Y5_CANTC|nr:uncharacterized protein CANTEDRAFT_115146 [Yamadazyma tenuis ATCC 10573]XP_006687859.1 uncharacterized protein CANTEDRAFT_115146 [Yamadazyma tenuis ATCC 10573]EGV61688.1 hypothetical protein CANTEDRAFT_115146 [Yamadazyma tenuis ATCC 10573]EGV61689.1 hypothetical protein CANTEDRAFT_115146 [Yamadazyma tenuis ATCC 10573]WEJ92914.1 hypothetical protein PSN45_000372 [Yamadazyma tenuis]